VSDHLGSPRYVVNVANSGDVPFTASYTSFGEVTGTGLDWMPFGFAGGIYDADSGLVRFGARDHDPVVGRWMAKDPILFDGGIGLYVYSENDPTNRIDNDGLAPKDKLFGLPKKFWNWVHRKVKEAGDPDLTKEEARELHKEWKEAGERRPDNRRERDRGPDDGDGWDDLFDWIIPFPPLLDPCQVMPEHCPQRKPECI
jgi:RHS repeat-associated protein